MKKNNSFARSVLQRYPKKIQEKLLYIRNLVYEVVRDHLEIGEVSETTKWGELSFVTAKKIGSTVRVGWRKIKPNEYCVYFNCKTSLVSQFRSQYKKLFHFEKNRAIVFHFDDVVPEKELKECIYKSLIYFLSRK